MWTANQISQFHQYRQSLRGSVALVPTMGALHAGHVSLMKLARQHADHVLVTIFVNPTQFAPHEDFARYPRPLEKDLQACRDAGVTGVFHPTAEEIYPPDVPACDVNVPALAGVLEGAVRPTHFAGVCRVVAKLFHLTQPDVACFGQKDYQQLAIIRAMTMDLNFPVRIIAGPTLRETDGLAMSSRNVYLSAEQRKQALGLSKALHAAQDMFAAGERDAAAMEQAMADIITDNGMQLDYAVVRHRQTLAELPTVGKDDAVALTAARLGSVRLIDNMLLGD